MGILKRSDIYWVVNAYIGVTDGYLGDFSYRTHREFYPEYCDLDINPEDFDGTTRERFVHILAAADAPTQAAILRGVARKYPQGSAVYRTKQANDQLSKLISHCNDRGNVAPADIKGASRIVEKALKDAATLLATNGATSAIDRVHTALHGYLKAACASQTIAVPADASMTQLFKLLKQHPQMQKTGAHGELVARVMNSLSAIIDAINTARNHGSMAHPNDALLDENEATLFINASHTILQYLDATLLRP